MLRAHRERLQCHKNNLVHKPKSDRVEAEEQNYEEVLEAYLKEIVDALTMFPQLSDYEKKPVFRYRVLSPLH